MKQTIFLATAILQLLTAHSYAYDNCTTARSLLEYNATRTYTMPGLSLSSSPSQLIMNTDANKPWYLTYRTGKEDSRVGDASNYKVWLETSQLPPVNLTGCIEHLWAYELGKYNFPRHVLERSVDDNGDCHAMLGEDCVKALNEKYTTVALQSIGRRSCTSLSMSNDIPAECQQASFNPGSWAGGRLRSGISFNYTNANDTETTCNPPVKPLNSTIQWIAGGGPGQDYDQLVTFPTPMILMFYPQKPPIGQGIRSNAVHVEVRCLRPSEVQDGSVKPPSAKELLDAKDVKYSNSSYNPNASTSSGASSSSSSKAAAVPMRTATPLLGAVGMGLALLV